ncbi:MAG: dephospho-CoA kinase [Weeksellaceae bacterium]
MKIIGLTGGIGSGKTTVGKWFAENGIPVYDSDTEAKLLIKENDELRLKISSLLGDEAYEDGVYNRKFVAAQVFANPKLLEKLNEIVHPAVFEHFHNWVKNQKSEFIIKEAAILFESGSYKDCDLIISVVAKEELRVERVVKRDGLNPKQVQDRIRTQWTDELRMEHSDFVINNDLDLSHLKSEFQRVYNELLKRFQTS